MNELLKKISWSQPIAITPMNGGQRVEVIFANEEVLIFAVNERGNIDVSVEQDPGITTGANATCSGCEHCSNHKHLALVK